MEQQRSTYEIRLGTESDREQACALIDLFYSPDETLYRAYAECNKAIYKIDLKHAIILSTSRVVIQNLLPHSPFIVAVETCSGQVVAVVILLDGEYPNLMYYPNTQIPDPNPRSTLQRIMYQLWLIKDLATLPVHFPNAQRFLNLTYFTVHGEHRRRGLGTKVLSAALEWSKLNGYQVAYGIFTSAASIKVARRLEMESVFEVDMGMIRGTRGEPIFADAGPDSLVSVMAIDFYAKVEADSTTDD